MRLLISQLTEATGGWIIEPVLVVDSPCTPVPAEFPLLHLAGLGGLLKKKKKP